MKKDYFNLSEVEPQELVQVILEHFSQGQGAYRFQLKVAIYHTSISQYRAAHMRPANAAAAATTTQSGRKKGERTACPKQPISLSLVGG